MPDDSPNPPPDLAVIKPEELAANDALAVEERAKFDQPSGHNHKHHDRRIEIELEDFEKEVANRALYTSRLFWLMFGWMLVVMLIIVCTGIMVPPHRKSVTGTDLDWEWYDWIAAFRLSEPVLMALIGGTTANVIGLFLVVAHYLFPRRHKVIESKDSR